MMDCACSHAHPSSDVLPACSPGPNHFTWARFQVQPVKPHSRRHIHKLLAQLFLFWSSVNLWVTCVPFFPYSTSNERRAPKVETNFAAHQPSQFNDTFLSQQSLSNYSLNSFVRAATGRCHQPWTCCLSRAQSPSQRAYWASAWVLNFFRI